MSSGSPSPAASPAKKTAWIYFAAFAFLNILIVGAFLGARVLGTNVNWINVVVILAIFNLLAFPAFVLVKMADSKKDDWGGAAETFGLIVFGVLCAILILLLPPSVKSWFSHLSPYNEVKVELLQKPYIDFHAPAGVTAPPKAPTGTQRVYVELPEAVKTDVDTVVVETRVPADKTTDGVLVDTDRKEIRIWYKTKDGKSYSADLR